MPVAAGSTGVLAGRINLGIVLVAKAGEDACAPSTSIHFFRTKILFASYETVGVSTNEAIVTSPSPVKVHFLTTLVVAGPFGVSAVVISVTIRPSPFGNQFTVRLPFGGVWLGGAKGVKSYSLPSSV